MPTTLLAISPAVIALLITHLQPALNRVDVPARRAVEVIRGLVALPGAHPGPQDRWRAIGTFKKSIDKKFPCWLLSAVRQITA